MHLSTKYHRASIKTIAPCITLMCLKCYHVVNIHSFVKIIHFLIGKTFALFINFRNVCRISLFSIHRLVGVDNLEKVSIRCL